MYRGLQNILHKVRSSNAFELYFTLICVYSLISGTVQVEFLFSIRKAPISQLFQSVFTILPSYMSNQDTFPRVCQREVVIPYIISSLFQKGKKHMYIHPTI